MKSIRTGLLLAAFATALPTVPAFAQTSVPSPVDLDPSHIIADQVATLSRDMVEPSSAQELRDAAARRLLAIGTNEARSAVQAALRDPGNSGGRLAAARAVADDLPGDPEFIDPLFVLLDANVPKPIVDSAVVALGNFKLEPDVSRRLIELSKAGKPEPQRVAAVRAMATQVEKRVAEQLVILTRDPSPAVANAAGEAIGQFASLNLASPTDWWKTQADHPEDRFRLEILNARATRFENALRRGEDTFQELRRSVLTAISTAPREQRGDILIRYLSSPRPGVRLIAVAQAYEYARTGDLPISARPAIRDLLTDADPDVRLISGRALGTLNDTDAFAMIARQLAVEADPRVRAELARTLGPIGNVDAVPVLRWLINDSSAAVVVAATNSLTRLGPALVQKSPTEAVELSIAIQAELQTRTTASPASSDVREALAGALVPLAQKSTRDTFIKMLTATPPESPALRRVAAAGLGEIGLQETAGLLVEALSDSTREVRLQAAESLGKLGEKNKTFENAEAIYHAMDPGRESDPEVRNREWATFRQLLPFAPINQLARWPDQPFIREDDQRLLDVYAVLEQKSAESKNWNDETTYIQQIGDTRMRLGEAAENAGDLAAARQQFNEATTNYQRALEVTRDKSLSAMRVQTMTVNTLNSLLRAREYAGAVSFASDQFKGPGGEELRGTLGPEFKAEAERLATKPGRSDDALSLIKEALAMKPSLPEQYLSHLVEAQQLVEKRQREKNEYAIPDFMRSLAMR